MNSCRVALVFVASVLLASCSEKSAPDQENKAHKTEPPRETSNEREMQTPASQNEPPLDEDKIAEDCVALVRSTRLVSASATSADCPRCPAGGNEVLSFRQMKVDRAVYSADTCSVAVTIHAVFNAGSGESIAGGLTAWIPPEVRNIYLHGEMPPGEQLYRVQITYQRRSGEWRAVDFDRAD